MYLVRDLFEQHGKNLNLKIFAGKSGLHRRINRSEVQRPGLSLTGFMKGFVFTRILVVGQQELAFLKQLDSKTRTERFSSIITSFTPAIIMARRFRPPIEMIAHCDQQKIPLFVSSLTATSLISRITFLLQEEFSPTITLHGTLVEVFGIGVLIQGDSSVGKSEAALGLIERGHRLISDDIVRVKKKDESSLLGSGPELTRHLMEIRGIGIINVANLYGAVCVRPDKNIDLVVRLEEWDSQRFYDRVGLDEKFTEILNCNVPYHILPVKPGRDVSLLLETISLNHRLKFMGYNSAKEFNVKWLEAIAKKQRKKSLHENYT